MGAIKPGDEPKIIGLVVGIVLVFGFAAWRVMGSTAAPEAAGPTDQSVAASATSLTDTPAQPIQPAQPEIEVPTLFSSVAMNPFRTVVAKVSVRPQQAPTASPPPISGDSRGFPALPPDSGLSPAHPTLPPVVRPVVKEDPIHVKGLMPGPNGVAVLKVGDDTFVVHQGERFSSGLVLLEIDKNGVQIKRDSKVVKVGVDE